MIPNFLLNFGAILGDVIYDIPSDSENVKPTLVKIKCDSSSSLSSTSSPEEYKNGTDVAFQKTLMKVLSRHRSILYDSSENLVHYRSSSVIMVANESQRTGLGSWNSEKGFHLLSGQTMDPDRRFFRIGIVPDVSFSYSTYLTLNEIFIFLLFYYFLVY